MHNTTTTNDPHPPKKKQYPKQPVYRVLEPDGAVRDGALEPQIEKEAAVRMYGTMARLQAMDQIFYNAQRQGRVSFYMTSTGEVSL
jgi:2-oxoisovalerate dehydrogenase E1 component alpha subunit